MQPLMGTFVEIEIESHLGCEELVSRVFEFGQSLEQILSRKDPHSELNNYNRSSLKKPSPLLEEALQLSLEMERVSEGFFSSSEATSGFHDLGGIAKGFIVDKMISFLLERSPQAQGVINAGGDLRFFNPSERKASLRLGPPDQPVWREWLVHQDAVATSSPGRSESDPRSSTTYRQPLRPPLKANDSVSVNASKCSIADALTKVGLFAKPEIIQRCSTVFQATIVVFNSQGQPLEIYAPQSQP